MPESHRLWHRCFPAYFVKFLGTPFYREHLWWLPQKFESTTVMKIIKRPLTITLGTFPANISFFKVNNRNIGKRCEICSNLTIKASERRQISKMGRFPKILFTINYLYITFYLRRFIRF